MGSAPGQTRTPVFISLVRIGSTEFQGKILAWNFSGGPSHQIDRAARRLS